MGHPEGANFSLLLQIAEIHVDVKRNVDGAVEFIVLSSIVAYLAPNRDCLVSVLG